MKKEVAKEVERTISPYSKKTPKEETVVLSGATSSVTRITPATVLPIVMQKSEKEISNNISGIKETENIAKIDEKKDEIKSEKEEKEKDVMKVGDVMQKGEKKHIKVK